MYDVVIVGSGYAGSICARVLAEQFGKKVLVLEKRGHIAGNMYDKYDEAGILVHQYGPHISVMNHKKTFDFLSRFTEWISYEHKVNAEIDGKEVPMPINLNSIEILFPEKSENIRNSLIQEYGFGSNVPILEMRNSKSQEIKQLADYIYEKVFLHYTIKMWGLKPDEIDPSVTSRIPVRISYDNRHFLHKYQVMPKMGFTHLFKNMLNHSNINVELNANAVDRISLDFKNNFISIHGKQFEGVLIYTGPLDELCGYQYGLLPYRSLKFEKQTYNQDYIQNTSVLNWPDDRPATRRTEMKRLTGQTLANKTTTITEYPGKYDKLSEEYSEPYYPISEKSCLDIYNKYVEKVKNISNFYFVGRLADYKYYNMEDTILTALDFLENNFKG